ncbi:FG-GAP-like repeat-containing protein [Streptomyces sp. NPDC056361]|uniref:FG-GAP-like repeat-containing protein n=1 Tax=Streptomyces sp. NPDC056361 TaxID=3345795 RepID=UPI0035DA5B0D
MIRTVRGRRALAAAVTTAASLATLMTAAPPAAADEFRCPSGSFCVFQYPNYGGEMKIISTSRPTLGTWNDKISSFINRSDKWAVAHLDAGYTGSGGMLIDPRQPSGTDLGWASWSAELDNKISSIRLGSTQWEALNGHGWMDWGSSDHPRPADLPAASKFGDLDGNGVADLVERADDGRLWFLNGVRDANWNTKGALIGSGWSAMTELVRHGDHNGDGTEDVYARDKAGVLWLYPGNGRGWFKPRIKIGGGWNGLREIEAVGDVTGDGRRDLVARDTAGVLWTYPGNGRGWFGARKKAGTGWNFMNRLVAPGDMTGDGRADLVARDGYRGLWLYPGNGRGGFGTRTKLPYAWPSNDALLTVGDVTGDGRSDLMRTINGRLYVYPGNGRGGIGAPRPDTSYDSATGVHVF